MILNLKDFVLVISKFIFCFLFLFLIVGINYFFFFFVNLFDKEKCDKMGERDGYGLIYFELNMGVKILLVGFGIWKLFFGEVG